MRAVDRHVDHFQLAVYQCVCPIGQLAHVAKQVHPIVPGIAHHGAIGGRCTNIQDRLNSIAVYCITNSLSNHGATVGRIKGDLHYPLANPLGIGANEVVVVELEDE